MRSLGSVLASAIARHSPLGRAPDFACRAAQTQMATVDLMPAARRAGQVLRGAQYKFGTPHAFFYLGNGSAAGQPQGTPPIWDTPGAIACGASLTHAYGHKAWRIYLFIYLGIGYTGHAG
jgi:hypothetical protein